MSGIKIQRMKRVTCTKNPQSKLDAIEWNEFNRSQDEIVSRRKERDDLDNVNKSTKMNQVRIITCIIRWLLKATGLCWDCWYQCWWSESHPFIRLSRCIAKWESGAAFWFGIQHSAQVVTNGNNNNNDNLYIYSRLLRTETTSGSNYGEVNRLLLDFTYLIPVDNGAWITINGAG